MGNFTNLPQHVESQTEQVLEYTDNMHPLELIISIYKYNLKQTKYAQI